MHFFDNFIIIVLLFEQISDIEKMGIDIFSWSAHLFHYKSLFRHYPNARKYIKEEKRYRNYSFEEKNFKRR